MQELQQALKAGLNGYKAMTIQVFSFMWLRTIMNYQYKNGGSFTEVLLKLYKEGGIHRLYSGIIPALIQGPLCRFGDTFSNAIVLNFLKPYPIPIFIKTGIASGTSGIIRIILSPIDTIKTMRQVEGKNALTKLGKKIKENGFLSLYDGALANGVLNIIGHYPWFLMHNYLDKYIPVSENSIILNLMRNAFIGFASSCFSDTISNSIRVLKTSKQTEEGKKGYKEIYEEIKKKEGNKGIFIRGLNTRLITNGIQGLMFNIMWKYFNRSNIKMIGNGNTNLINNNNDINKTV